MAAAMWLSEAAAAMLAEAQGPLRLLLNSLLTPPMT